MLCASNPGKDSCQGESGGDDDHEEKKDKRQRRGKYDGNNRYRYIDLQQVYLLQSEALKYLLSCLFASTFAIEAVSSTDQQITIHNFVQLPHDVATLSLMSMLM